MKILNLLITTIKDEENNFIDFKTYFDKYINIFEKIEQIEKENDIDGLFIALNHLINVIQVCYKHNKVEMKEDDKNV